MADLEKTVAIIFSGVDELSGPMRTITSNLDGFSTGIESIASPLAGVADNILKVDAALTAMAAGSLLYAFNESKNYEQAMIELQKVMGDSETVTEEMKNQFTSLSREYGVSSTSIISSLAELRQSGFDTAGGMEILSTSLKLSRASELSVEESTNLLKRTLIGYKLEVADAIKVGDLWNHSSQVSNTNVQKLAEAFAIVSRQAADSGFSMEQTAAALAPIIGVFDSGEEAGIAFSTMLSRILDPTKKGEIAIRALTGAAGPLNEEFATGKDLFEAVAGGLQRVDSQTGLVAVAQIVGVQQAKRIKVAFDDYYKTLGAIGPAADRYKSLQKEVDLQNDSAVAAVDRLKTGFNELARVIGDQFREAAVEAIDGGTKIENALENIVKSGTFKPVFDAFNEFLSEMGQFLSKVAADLPEAFEQVDFDVLLDALKEVGGSIGDLFEGVDLTTPEGLADAIQKVINTLATLANVTAGMFSGFKPFIDSIIGLAESFNNMDVASQKSAGEILALAKVVTEAGFKFSLLIIAVSGGADKLAPLFKVIVNTIAGALDLTVIAWKGLGLAFLEVVDGVLAASQLLTKIPGFGFLRDDVEANREAIAKWKDSLEKDMQAAGDSAVKNLTGMQSNFTGLGESARGAIGEVKKVPGEIDKIPDEKRTEIEANTDMQSFHDAMLAMNAIPDEKTTDVKTETDKASVDKTKNEIDAAAPFSKLVRAALHADKDSIAKTKSAFAEIPELKMIELQLKRDKFELEKIKVEADAIQAHFEWTAKLDIAQVEADAKKVAAAFDAAASSVEATASAGADMFSSLVGNWDKFTFASDRKAMMGMVRDQLNMEREALSIQRDLTEATIEYMQAKSDALRDGDGLIKIDSSGLEPALEMVMWQILEKVQLRATEEAAEFLLGLGTARPE